MRVLKFCREVDFSTEALHAQLGGDIGRENFDDDLSSEIAIHRHEDATHPTPDELALEGVAIAEGALEGRPKVSHPANLLAG